MFESVFEACVGMSCHGDKCVFRGAGCVCVFEKGLGTCRDVIGVGVYGGGGGQGCVFVFKMG